MNHAIRTAIVTALASLCLCSGAGAKFATFQIPGAFGVYPTAMNDKRQVTGLYDDPAGRHGFVWQPGGTPVTFDIAGTSTLEPRGISATGVVAGFCMEGGRQEGFIRTPDGTITTYNVGDLANPGGMNAKGWVVGSFMSNDPRHPWRSFLRDPTGTIREFSLQGVPTAVGLVLNKSRTIAGTSVTQGPYALYQGFIRTRHGPVTLFGSPQEDASVTGINDADTVVGFFGQPPRAQGFVRTSDGTITTFTGPNGAGLGWTTGINNSGTVAGSFMDGAGIWHGFLRTPMERSRRSIPRVLSPRR